VPLVDVLRAAASEVEAYDRIELVGIPDSDIHGSAVSDLVHLLAELLENATTFSSPQTKVRVTATRLPDGRVMVEIHDKGIGLTAEDFADINHKLAEPPTVDVEIAKRMGLFVVGRLSDRHGIRVQLRPSGEQAGTTSLVMLPEPITHGGGGDELGDGEGDFTVSRIVPEAPEQPAHGRSHESAELGRRTAAELGFDDSRYDQPAALEADGTPALDPVGRSLRREGRRAQLEAAVSGDRDDEQLQPEHPYQQQQFEQPQQQPQPFEGFEPYGQQQGPIEPVGMPQQAQEGPYEPHSGYEPSGSYDQSFDSGYQQQTYEQGFQGGYAQQGYPAQAEGAPYEQNGFFAQPYGSPGEQPETVYDPGYDRNFGSGDFNGLPEQPSESVGSPSLTDAGLPRRDRTQRNAPQEQPAQETPEPQNQPQNQPQPDDSGWRSNNDENWQRAESVREPKAGGVTPSGLPRRVPKANLVPGTATQTPQGGPQVSRAPEDVRGRLSNLRRGVQQGRTAGTDTNGQATDRNFGGPQNQER
jgi:hypothetical protein